MRFTTTIQRLDDGLRHHYVPIPTDIVASIKGQGARRVIATINGTEIRRALNTRTDGHTFLVLGQPLQK